MVEGVGKKIRELGPQLVASGLLSAELVGQIASHSDSVPFHDVHKLFLEFEVADNDLIFEGYGHGFRADAFSYLLTDESCRNTGLVRQIKKGLLDNPFLERAIDEPVISDGNPNWVEYDYVDDVIREIPAMFFAPPPSLRVIRSETIVNQLHSILRDSHESPEAMSLKELLKALHAESASGVAPRIYRVGRCEARVKDWLRLIIGGIEPHAFRPSAIKAFGDYDSGPIDRIVAVAQDSKDPLKLAASIDIVKGGWNAMDIEAPFFANVPVDERALVAEQYSKRLVRDGILSQEQNSIVAANASLSLLGESRKPEARVVIDHYKFGVAGRTRGRTKVYFELLMARAGIADSLSWI